MSNLRLDNIGNRVGSLAIPIDTVLHGTAKAWLNLNGTGTIATRDSFNVSSVVDNGTGSYTANFATAFPNANYSVAPSARVSGTIVCGSASMESGSVNAVQVFASTVTSSPAAIDVTYMLAALFGDPV